MQPSPNHEKFILECYALARSATKNGNHPFGVLLVTDGEIVPSAENTVNSEKDATRHAELNLVGRALRELGTQAVSECTLYASTEPCAMCAGAIYWAGIPKVVYGCSTAWLGKIAGGSFSIPCREILEKGKRPTQILGPVLEEEGIEIHRNFW
ncbi:MAG: nucleoside deaminase [Proteobacteria bacterium]|nr:nucleoside deaminase [Pseudomonadota bacterium]